MTQQPQEPQEPKNQPLKAIRILHLLSQGVEVSMFERTLVMGETSEGRPAVGIKGTKQTGNGPIEDILLPLDIELNEFLAACEELNDLEIPIPVPRLN